MEKDRNTTKFKYLYIQRKKGFILTRTLIAFIIVILMISISLSSFRLIKFYKYEDQDIQDEIACIQLTRILSIASNIEINNDEVSFISNNKTWNIKNINGNLVLQPGTQFILIDIENVSFQKESAVLYISYKRGDKEYRRALINV